MVLLQYYEYTKYFMYTDINSSPLLFNFEIFVAIVEVALLEREQQEKYKFKSYNKNI